MINKRKENWTEIEIETGIGDIINKQISELHKRKIKEEEDILFDFLRKHGYRPRRTEKYMNNLKKKLDKQGLTIKLDEIVLEEKYDMFGYRKRCVYVPSFVEKE